MVYQSLGDPDLVAAIGFASTLTFLATSISIGTSIAAGALVSRSLGAKDREKLDNSLSMS